jgi:hypothetical protein
VKALSPNIAAEKITEISKKISLEKKNYSKQKILKKKMQSLYHWLFNLEKIRQEELRK